MARWSPLPNELDPTVVQFVAMLRYLKDSREHTMRRLASETGYSVASWERYLAGRALPPREAVVRLAAVMKVDEVRLLALHEGAAEAWTRSQAGRGGTAVDGDQAPLPAGEFDPAADVAGATSAPRPGILPLLRRVAALTAAAAVGAVLAVLLMPSGAAPHAAVASTVIVNKLPHYACTYRLVAGRWYAGNSTNSSGQLVVDMHGPDVAELQCLLQRIGITPGGIDGSFGPLTEAAVIKAQKRLGLDIDGQVGPATWAALRK